MQTEPSRSTANFYQVLSKCTNNISAPVTPAQGMEEAVLLHTPVDTFAFLYFARRKKKKQNTDMGGSNILELLLGRQQHCCTGEKTASYPKAGRGWVQTSPCCHMDPAMSNFFALPS